MIGGHDVSFHTPSPAQATEAAIRTVLAFWPGAVVENADTAELLDRASIGIGGVPEETLIYKNADARASWTTHGAVPENANSMIHVLREEDAITIVVDDPGVGEMPALLGAIREHLYQDTPG